MQAEAGYLSLTGEPDGPPARMGLSIVDLMTGPDRRRSRCCRASSSARDTGMGRDLDVSLFDTALQNLCYLATWYLNAGVVTRAASRARPSLAHAEPALPHATTASSSSCATRRSSGRCSPKRWASPNGRRPGLRDLRRAAANRELITAGSTTFSMPPRRRSGCAARGQVPAAPVNDVRQALDNPFVAEQQLALDFEHAEHGNIRGVASPVRVDGGDTQPRRAAPRLGEDTDALLEELGYAPHAIGAARPGGGGLVRVR